jgi:hypothetical protein
MPHSVLMFTWVSLELCHFPGVTSDPTDSLCSFPLGRASFPGSLLSFPGICCWDRA